MVTLIAYADRLAGNLQALHDLLNTEFRDLFGGIHILPFFDPIDGADAGFDPVDHLAVDPRLGTWEDVGRIASDFSVMADLIVNHVSADSAQFRDVVANSRSSPHWDLFLRKAQVFPAAISEAAMAGEIAAIYRPRPTPPFTALALADGDVHEFWTSFSPQQLDINVESVAGRRYLESILDRFAASGIREVRLDAAGYAIKRRGTSCFMLPETRGFIGELAAEASRRGVESLVEIHSHFLDQVELAEQSARVYDFALPPLVLHALYRTDAAPIKKWLGMSPRNCVTVLDTHDGIGIADIARHGEREGLLDDGAVSDLVETIHRQTAGASRRASGYAASNLDVYQVNSTYYDALGRRDCDYLIARAIQFFAPGTPQVYYVGLLAGENDLPLVEKTGVGRDINRHFYSLEEIHQAMRRPVVQRLLELIHFRNRTPAFNGDFSIGECPDSELLLRWDSGDDFARLHVDLRARQARVSHQSGGNEGEFIINASTVNSSLVRL